MIRPPRPSPPRSRPPPKKISQAVLALEDNSISSAEVDLPGRGRPTRLQIMIRLVSVTCTYVKGLVTIRMIDRVLLVVSSYYLSLES